MRHKTNLIYVRVALLFISIVVLLFIDPFAFSPLFWLFLALLVLLLCKRRKELVIFSVLLSLVQIASYEFVFGLSTRPLLFVLFDCVLFGSSLLLFEDLLVLVKRHKRRGLFAWLFLFFVSVNRLKNKVRKTYHVLRTISRNNNFSWLRLLALYLRSLFFSISRWALTTTIVICMLEKK